MSKKFGKDNNIALDASIPKNKSRKTRKSFGWFLLAVTLLGVATAAGYGIYYGLTVFLKDNHGKGLINKINNQWQNKDLEPNSVKQENQVIANKLNQNGFYQLQGFGKTNLQSALNNPAIIKQAISQAYNKININNPLTVNNLNLSIVKDSLNWQSGTLNILLSVGQNDNVVPVNNNDPITVSGFQTLNSIKQEVQSSFNIQNKTMNLNLPNTSVNDWNSPTILNTIKTNFLTTITSKNPHLNNLFTTNNVSLNFVSNSLNEQKGSFQVLVNLNFNNTVLYSSVFTITGFYQNYVSNYQIVQVNLNPETNVYSNFVIQTNFRNGTYTRQNVDGFNNLSNFQNNYFNFSDLNQFLATINQQKDVLKHIEENNLIHNIVLPAGFNIQSLNTNNFLFFLKGGTVNNVQLEQPFINYNKMFINSLTYSQNWTFFNNAALLNQYSQLNITSFKVLDHDSFSISFVYNFVQFNNVTFKIQYIKNNVANALNAVFNSLENLQSYKIQRKNIFTNSHILTNEEWSKLIANNNLEEFVNVLNNYIQQVANYFSPLLWIMNQNATANLEGSGSIFSTNLKYLAYTNQIVITGFSLVNTRVFENGNLKILHFNVDFKYFNQSGTFKFRVPIFENAHVYSTTGNK